MRFLRYRLTSLYDNFAMSAQIFGDISTLLQLPAWWNLNEVLTEIIYFHCFGLGGAVTNFHQNRAAFITIICNKFHA